MKPFQLGLFLVSVTTPSLVFADAMDECLEEAAITNAATQSGLDIEIARAMSPLIPEFQVMMANLSGAKLAMDFAKEQGVGIAQIVELTKGSFSSEPFLGYLISDCVLKHY